MLAPLLASLAAVTTPIPAPPVPPIAPPPGSTVIVMPPHGLSSRPGVTQHIAVEVRQDGHVIWSGEMVRASTGTASFNQQLRESRACSSAMPNRFSVNDLATTGLNVSINRDYRTSSDDPDADNIVQVGVERTRPYGTSDVCAGEGNSSSVRFTAITKVIPGKPVTLTGEGGLSVVLTLR